MMDHDDMRMKIRHLRLERRMTQKQLADAMHVSCSLIGHIERGSRKPSLETLVSLCKVLNIPVDDLLYSHILIVDDIYFLLRIWKAK